MSALATVDVAEIEDWLRDGKRTVGLHRIATPSRAHDELIQVREPLRPTVCWRFLTPETVRAITLAHDDTIVHVWNGTPLVMRVHDTISVHCDHWM